MMEFAIQSFKGTSSLGNSGHLVTAAKLDKGRGEIPPAHDCFLAYKECALPHLVIPQSSFMTIMIFAEILFSSKLL